MRRAGPRENSCDTLQLPPSCRTPHNSAWLQRKFGDSSSASAAKVFRLKRLAASRKMELMSKGVSLFRVSIPPTAAVRFPRVGRDSIGFRAPVRRLSVGRENNEAVRDAD